MIELRPFAQIGAADHGWLNAHHHFSFASYLDRNRMGWGSIRVWNDDTIAPHTGFATHGHENMEIITYVRTGAISHKDSLGSSGRTVAGDVQVMSAGAGIQHSEYNHEGEPCTLFQIWVLPREKGGAPYYDFKPFPKDARAGQWVVLASGFEGDAGTLPIRADARVLGATLAAGSTLTHEVGPGRHAYLVPATGKIDVDGVAANARDGVGLTEGHYTITALEEAELVLVDAP
ncbi:MAG: pirin family protein [Alphaproteobacteria bacterium]|nr:pirin family protein [Alphaproteobacteria bacterium]MDE2041674.1 pirin family protein [Alphaproteobacteria bacterium]MDE2340399.1 pirin family protein [Alphaproteobacteria bacterium]